MSNSRINAFQQAQQPTMWVSAADELTDAASPVFQAAVAQLPKFEDAKRAATEAAKRAYEQSNDGFGIAAAFLLYGFAIENSLKGLIVNANPGIVGANKIAVPNHHDLNDLAAEAGYTPTIDEADLLRKLTTITTWSGRYPVALT